MRIERALVSVSDKSGLETFARGLHELGVELVSTSGTAAALAEAGIPFVERRGSDRRRRDAGRPREDAAPVDPRRHPRPPRPGRGHADARGAGHQADRHGRLQPLSVPRRREPPRGVRAGGDREHRRRRPDHGARGGQEPPGGRGGHRTRALRLPAGRAARRRRVVVQRDAARPRGRGVRAHRRLRRRHLGMVHGHRSLPRAPRARPGEGRRSDVRREPAPARRLLRRGGGAASSALADRAAGRQGAVVQQPRRPERRALRRRRIPGAGMRDRQARQPVRRRGRGDGRGGVREGAWRPTRCQPTEA